MCIKKKRTLSRARESFILPEAKSVFVFVSTSARIELEVVRLSLDVLLVDIVEEESSSDECELSSSLDRRRLRPVVFFLLDDLKKIV